MSSTATAAEAPQTVEQQLSPEAAGIVESLSFDKIDELRLRQRGAYLEAQSAAFEAGASTEEQNLAGNAAISSLNNEYLDSILQSDVGQNNAVAIESVLNMYSYRNMNDTDWRYGKPSADAEGDAYPSGRERLQGNVTDFREVLDGVEPAEPTIDDPLENEPPVTNNAEKSELQLDLEKEVADLRANLAKLTAKRQARVGGEGGKKYEAALAAYNQKVIELGRVEKKDALESDKLSDEDKRVIVTEFLFTQQKELREQVMAELKGGKVYAFVEWMNRGSKWKRAGKGLLVGAGAGLVGAGLGALAGVAGVAGAAAGLTLAAVSAGRFARAYARSDAIHHQGMKDHGDADKEKAKTVGETADEDHFDTMTSYFNRQLEQDTKKEQSKQRKKVAWGVGGIAVGGLLAAGIFTAVDAANFDGISNRNVHFGSTAEAQPVEVDTDAAHERMFDITEDYDGETGNADGSTTSPETATPESMSESASTEIEPVTGLISNVGFGQGGIEVFQNSGLTEQQWNQVAPGLAENFKDIFYVENGDVRIRPQGELPDYVQGYIKKSLGL